MKKTTIITILIIILISNIVFCDDLSLNGQSYILIDCISGRVLYEKNAHTKMPMASTTKIMTALIALENGNLDDEIEVSREAVGIEGSSIYLVEDEKISLKDLLYGLMLSSGNDAAIAISTHIGGTVDEFIKMMNSKAMSLGAKNTNFVNPHGLHHDEHYTTAYDLALITKEAFRYDIFSEIVKSKSYISNREKNNYFLNKNKTLWQYDGGNGVKTGYTMRSGRCLVSSATKNNMKLIAVSLNARDWFNDNYNLLDYGFKNYKPYLIYDKGQLMKSIEVTGGNKDLANLVSGELLFYPLKEDEKKDIKIIIDAPEQIKAPLEKDQKVGSINTFLNGILINKTDLKVKSSIKKLKIWKKIFFGH